MSESEGLGLQIVFASILVFIYIVSGHLLETYKCIFLHESTVAILLGIFFAYLTQYIWGQEIHFSGSGFFLFILPPIIFSAGFTLKRRNFIKNLKFILTLGNFGTIIAMLVLSTGVTYYNNHYMAADRKL